MKAFMSDIQRPDSQPARESCGCPNAAMREARRILAVTEPDTPETALFCIERLSGDHCARNVWTDALIDTLRAFVEE